MKIASLTIDNMHNIDHKTFTLRDLNYLFGKNGSGKSTVLNAIQLALLGYIPGTKQTKEAIFKHCSGNNMQVEVTFDDGRKITRYWKRTNKGIVSGDNISDELNISDIIKDIELPVFNFSKFISMTSNGLKDWFLSFLPSSKNSINWNEEIDKAISDNGINLTYTDFVDLCKKEADNANTNCSDTLETIRSLNTKYKELLSYKKGELSRLDSTIQSIAYYEDVDETADLNELQSELDSLNLKKSNLSYDISSVINNEGILQCIENMKKEYDIDFDRYHDCPDDDEIIAGLRSSIEEYDTHMNDIKTEVDESKRDSYRLNEEKKSYESILSGEGICPYTKCNCEYISEYIDSLKEKVFDIESKLDTIDDTISEKIDQLNRYEDAKKIEQNTLDTRLNHYSEYNSYLNNLIRAIPIPYPKSSIDMNEEIHDIDVKITEIQDNIIKIKSNLHFRSIQDKIVEDKFKCSEDIEVVKSLIDVTGVNGLQNEIMNSPFADLADNISFYLKSFFKDNDIKASFNLSTKSNSFSFGIIRNKVYLDYDILSSGEKCLYTLALLISLVKSSTSDIHLILIDDILDHLDDNKIDNLFKALYELDDIQILLAGVKPCNHSDAQKIVINMGE